MKRQHVVVGPARGEPLAPVVDVHREVRAGVPFPVRAFADGALVVGPGIPRVRRWLRAGLHAVQRLGDVGHGERREQPDQDKNERQLKQGEPVFACLNTPMIFQSFPDADDCRIPLDEPVFACLNTPMIF